MIIKKKSILVIVVSSVLISLVLITTLIGFYLYLNWKADGNKSSYSNSLRQLNAELYGRHIEISSLRFKLDRDADPAAIPLIEGRISNKSNKKISYLKLKLSLSDKAGCVLYTDYFYPLTSRTYFGAIPKQAASYLAPSDSISFKHTLRGCPEKILSYLKTKYEFVKSKDTDKIDMRYKIEEISI